MNPLSEIGDLFKRSWQELVNDYANDAEENAYDGKETAESFPQSYWSEHDVKAQLYSVLVKELKGKDIDSVHVECSLSPDLFGREDSTNRRLKRIRKILHKTPRVDILIDCQSPGRDESSWAPLIAELKFFFALGKTNPMTKGRKDQIEECRKDLKKLDTIKQCLGADTEVYFCLIDNLPRNHPEEKQTVLDDINGFEGVGKLTYFGPMMK